MPSGNEERSKGDTTPVANKPTAARRLTWNVYITVSTDSDIFLVALLWILRDGCEASRNEERLARRFLLSESGAAGSIAYAAV